jgi:hypothetical protein
LILRDFSACIFVSISAAISSSGVIVSRSRVSNPESDLSAGVGDRESDGVRGMTPRDLSAAVQ